MQNTDDDMAVTMLRYFFQRNSYARHPKATRQEKEGHTKYKKGTEIRLVLKSEAEVEAARQALVQLALKPGAPFAKAKQLVLPIYGKKKVARFLQIIESVK
jgi:hypothetical protein